MTPVSGPRLVYEFDLAFDRYQAQKAHTINLVDKVRTINDAVQIYFVNRVRFSELDETVREALRPFEVKEASLTKVGKAGKDITIFAYPKDAFRLIRRRIRASKAGCTVKKDIPLSPMRASEISLAVSSLWAPSFEWEQGLYDEGESGIYVMHQGAYNVDACLVDYYRYPKEVHAASLSATGSYVDWNNRSINYDTDLELTGFDYQTVIDIAVLVARARYGDVTDYEIQLRKILQTSQLNTQ